MERRRDRTRKPAATRRIKKDHLPVYAAIDLGTNNCRLLIAQPDGESFSVVDSFSRIVRLGEGLVASGKLADAAIERTTDALRVCASKMRQYGTRFTRSVATEACRQASNSQLFFDRVEAETGIKLEVIPAVEEAKLTLAGCAPLIAPDTRHALLFDIGGGSTEVMWVETGDGDPKLHDIISIPLGVVSLAERFGHDTVTAADYGWIIDRITADLDAFNDRNGIAEHLAGEPVQMLGTSGTVTTLAGIHLDLPRYDRSRVDGLTIDFESIAAIVTRVAGMDFETRSAHPCIRRERADLMVMGCAILDAICRRWPVGRLRVADRGIREGILLAMMAAQGRADHAPTPVP